MIETINDTRGALSGATEKVSWSDIGARRDAAAVFAQMLENDPYLREQCKADSALARRTFAEAGGFYDIPASVIFHVFEEDDQSRDDLVVLVLPPKGSLSEEDEKDILRCTIRPPTISR